MAQEISKISKKDQQKIEKEVKKKLHKRLLSATKSKTIFLKAKFREHTSTAMIAAFGFLIALVWRDLISAVVKGNTSITLLEKYPYAAELWSALIITIIAIIGIAFVSRWATKPEEKPKENPKDKKKKKKR